MFEAYTIKDIARALGLSTSTVSRALNGSYEIGTETKRLVLEYAEKINYQPNPIALSLKEQKSHSIGVVVAEVANNYFSQAINGIESIAYDRNYHVIITQTHESYKRETTNVQHLMSRHVDGLLVSLSAGTTDLEHYKQLHARGLPIVFFDRVAPDINTHKVVVDNFKGAFEATEVLIKTGFKRIAPILNSFNLLISQERLEGFKAALQKHKLPFIGNYLESGYNSLVDIDVDTILEGMLTLDERPDALFLGSDRMTTKCLQVIKRLGFKVPDDVAIVGFTNSDTADLFDPPLTVVRQPAFQIGQIATEMLINLIESKQPVTEFRTEVLQTQLIVRGSSKKVAQKISVLRAM